MKRRIIILGLITFVFMSSVPVQAYIDVLSQSVSTSGLGYYYDSSGGYHEFGWSESGVSSVSFSNYGQGGSANINVAGSMASLDSYALGGIGAETNAEMTFGQLETSS